MASHGWRRSRLPVSSFSTQDTGNDYPVGRDRPGNDETRLALQSAFNFDRPLNLLCESFTFLVLQFFDHPIIIDLMNERWYGDYGPSYKSDSPRWWLFLNIWCLFDSVLFPLSFFSTFVPGKTSM